MKQDNISIRALEQSDWKDLKTMRLLALKMHGDVFGGKYEDIVKWHSSKWQDLLDGNGKQIFGLFDNAQIIGITGVISDRDDPSRQTGLMVMSFIAPEYRGQKLSRLLYEARIDWAVHQSDFLQLKIGHREGYEASRRANQAFGFKHCASKMVLWPDGTDDIRHDYTLDLNDLRKHKHTYSRITP